MSQMYLIQWSSKANGVTGRGTRRFSRDEAERLAAELNAEYPQVHHQAVVAPAVAAPTAIGSAAPPENVPAVSGP